ncbi:redoxin domain-containing protein [Parafrankia sp. FMc2]|uniref:redoxin domain-containing protein n=1 Tax=Parafrankia sp. FMc2 TaxID=3233196 RepID=UPI0034D6B2CA
MATPAVGQPAPDFTLPGLTLADRTAARSDLTLSQERGHPVVLAFHPGDNTPACTKQLCSHAAGIEVLRGLGAPVWGIGINGVTYSDVDTIAAQLATF